MVNGEFVLSVLYILNVIKNTANRKFAALFFAVMISIFSVVVSGCIFSDSGGPETKPSITSLSISDGEFITSRDVIIYWKGNSRTALYQYTLDNITSEVTADTTVTLTDLEETDHTFILQAFDETQTIKSEPDSITFTVNAITGPGIVFSPRKISTEPSVTIILENVNRLMAAHIELISENKSVLFGIFTENESLVENGEIISLSNAATSERFTIDIAFAGKTEGLSGSLPIGTLSITSLREGIVSVDSTATIFRDINNEALIINGLDFVRVVK